MRPSISLMAAISGRIALMSRSCLVPKTFAIILSMGIIEPPVLTPTLAVGITIGLRVFGERSAAKLGEMLRSRREGNDGLARHHPQRMPERSFGQSNDRQDCLRRRPLRPDIQGGRFGHRRHHRQQQQTGQGIRLVLVRYGGSRMAAIIAADSAERPSSGAKVTRMIRPNRTEVLLLPILALVGQDCRAC